MTVHLVTFSDESMSRSRDLCITSAVRHGIDDVIQWQATPCKGRHPDVNYLMEVMPDTEYWARGFGYWKWKPAIIADALRLTPRVTDGDILIYADAGVEFINNVRYIIDRMDQDIFLFGNNWEHAHWCKRDVIEAIWPRDETLPMPDIIDADKLVPWSRFGKQCQASVIFFRVSDYSRKFVTEWLKWCLYRQRFSQGVCTDEWRYLIDDSPSILPNHPEFREHRHDQAILTTLAYREGIKLHYWPAQYNDGAFSYEKLPEYAGDDYPILFHHHRRRNHEWSEAA